MLPKCLLDRNSLIVYSKYKKELTYINMCVLLIIIRYSSYYNRKLNILKTIEFILKYMYSKKEGRSKLPQFLNLMTKISYLKSSSKNIEYTLLIHFT